MKYIVLEIHSIGNRHDEGKRILDFAVINNLCIMNTFYQHRESQKWTWYRWNNQRQEYTDKSTIDLFLTNQKGIINDVKAVPSVSLDADHRLVIAKLKIKIAVKKAGSSQKRFNLVKLKERDTKDALVKKLEENFQDNVEEMGIEASWLRFKKKVLGVAGDVLGERSVYKGKKKTTLWWTENVQAAVREKIWAFRRRMKTRQPEDRLSYEISRKNTERVKNAAKQDMWAKIRSDLEDHLSGTKKLLYSMAKIYRGKIYREKIKVHHMQQKTKLMFYSLNQRK